MLDIFDLDELLRGFSNQDEYIAENNLQAYIKMVQDQKKAYVQKRLDEYVEGEKKDDTI